MVPDLFNLPADEAMMILAIAGSLGGKTKRERPGKGAGRPKGWMADAEMDDDI